MRTDAAADIRLDAVLENCIFYVSPMYEFLHTIARSIMSARGLLHREIIKIMELPEVREKLVALGFETVASTPEEFAARIKLEIPKWGKVIRDANIKPTLRLEWRGQNGQDEAKQSEHGPLTLGDSFG